MRSKRVLARGVYGEQIQVVRPDNAAIPLALAEVAAARNDKYALERLPLEAEAQGVSYRVIGYLATRNNGKQCVVDADGNFVGELVAGDSLVSGWENRHDGAN